MVLRPKRKQTSRPRAALPVTSICFASRVSPVSGEVTDIGVTSETSIRIVAQSSGLFSSTTVSSCGPVGRRTSGIAQEPSFFTRHLMGSIPLHSSFRVSPGLALPFITVANP